ncbi:bifunctional aminoglycoside phosphotransferase/ATP-binding protein [Bradyrhizobium sp.]|uniref:bifunctional aminoglycoside phosphotransferase/ATP-binding protein n=1 Tax=Bradyrhizobium sp. TaxID=376 RepID=UPI0025BD7A82|nr:bifunctional aminoglycoside phosphotransferase/ATP-binding protein [Bradyrhizobium sp.]
MTEQRPVEVDRAAGTDQQRVLDFLDASSFGAAKGGKRIDTHISMVFLGGDRALKIKRAVRLPFLDYSTLEKRKRACEEELKVNARNAPQLYRRVVAITRRPDGTLEVDGAGIPVEWAVEMMRFDEERALDRIAASATIDPALAVAVADVILLSHNKAPRADGSAWLASIASIIDRNTAAFHAVAGLDAAAIDRLHALSHHRAAQLRSLLGRRAEQGFVRRCHGDLHLANIALVDNRPLLFDAIEFDPVIATTDVLYDLAFTLMDMIHFNQGAAANVVLNRYLAAASDEDLDGLGSLPLFLSMRAAVRAHVSFMKSEQARAGEAARREARNYFDLALRLIAPKPPMLVAIGGLSGTGKSVLARGLAGLIEPPPGALIVRSDVIRKRLFGVSETVALPDLAYQAGTTEQVYDRLLSVAQRVLAHGCSVVLDAACLRESERARISRLAITGRARFVGLFLTADLATRLARIERRKNDASDATLEVALKQDTLEIGPVDWPMVDASGTAGDTLRRACAFLTASIPVDNG